MPLHILVNMDDLTRAEAGLNMHKDKTKYVLRSAINNTAKQTQKLLIDESVKLAYLRSKAEATKTISIKKATMKDLAAIVTSKGKTLELRNEYSVRPRGYNPKKRPKAGHKGNVLRSKPARNLYLKKSGRDKYKAFVVKFKNGHISIAQRVPGTKTTRKKLAVSANGKKVNRREWQAEQIKNIRSTSIPALLGGKDRIYRQYAGRIEDMLVDNIMLQMQRYMK